MSNPILQLKGSWETRIGPKVFGPSEFNKMYKIHSSQIGVYLHQLKDVYSRWMSDQFIISGALVSIYYSKIIPKSNRIKDIFVKADDGDEAIIRGVKFGVANDGNHQKHIFTYYMPLQCLKKSIEGLEKVKKIVEVRFGGCACGEDLNALPKDFSIVEKFPKTKFLSILHDLEFIESFGIDSSQKELCSEDQMLVSLYETVDKGEEILRRLGINVFDNRILNATTFFLKRNEIEILKNKAPYLISMGLVDFKTLTDEASCLENDDILVSGYPSPKNEPTIGVIDTQFNSNVKFHEWVTATNMLGDVCLQKSDYWHGTAVTSIIVDGPRLNPNLEDGCGRFKVRHFGVATSRGFSSFQILRMIREIIETNRDIKVWNLSLGSAMEINSNFISPEAAELDNIQNLYDVIFVVAGTNIPESKHGSHMKIGSPADSLNSLVVNSVDFDDRPAPYTRVGPVLSFFHKPDVCYYGGVLETGIHGGINVDDGRPFIRCCGGTSYAAPWISRKLAYLIHVIGLSREVAKALIVDAASRWNPRQDVNRMGYGVVPIHISKILKTPDDEIRFVVSGVSEKYETFTYQLPVPMQDGNFPYFARATLVYFPYCNRNNGVDYTGTEIDIRFGRLQKDKNGKITISSIDNNKQGDEGGHGTTEAKARDMYRKWDNVKHIVDKITTKSRPRKSFGFDLWGLSVKSKERTFYGSRNKINFGIVITLKEMRGINRFDDFVQHCMARGWIVNRIDLHSQSDIYSRAEERLIFD